MTDLQSLFDTVEWHSVLAGGLRVLLIVAGGWIVLRAIRAGLRRFERNLVARAAAGGEGDAEAAKRAETLGRLLRQAASVLVLVVLILMILRELGIEIGPILASAGIAGLAVGFGAQNLVRDVISGFFLILENQVRVGDVAVINGTGGLVENINFRTIVLRDLSGTVHIFPNGTVNTVANLTKEWSAYVFEIGVAYKEDTDRVVEVMRAVGEDLRADERFGPSILDDVEIFGVDKLADSSVVIKGRIRTLPIKQWEVGREFLRRVKKAFDRAGIEIPFPHRQIQFNDTGKPLAVRLAEQAAGAQR